MIKKLKEKKKEILNDLFENLLFLICFPIFGLIMAIWYIIDSINEIIKINKKIKIEKIKDVLRGAALVKDINGNVKDIII